MNALVLPLARALSTSCRRAAKPGYFLYKLLDREKAVERKIMAMYENKLITAKKLPSEATRRQKVLNTLYMETITGVLASEFGERLAEHRITVMEVRINKDLTVINVYWTSTEGHTEDKDTRQIEETSKALAELAPEIRAELSAVRHMGVIPKIQFVHYVGAEKEQEVKQILDRLRAAGELEDVEPAVQPLHNDTPYVYGLDREKILREVETKSAPADSNLAARLPLDTDIQESVLKSLRLRKLKNRRDDRSSTKFRHRLEREIYEQNFAIREEE